MAAPKKKLNLRKTLFLLPNMITLSSIFCGFDSIRLSGTATGDEDYYLASLLLVYALFFDMLDGRVARLTKTQSAFGLQIDSLADVVSFGVAPSMLVYQWTLHRLGLTGLIVAFVFTACGAVRSTSRPASSGSSRRSAGRPRSAGPGRSASHATCATPETPEVS